MMDKELEEMSKDHETASKSCCLCACTTKKVLFALGVVGLIGGIVWLALSCPSCH